MALRFYGITMADAQQNASAADTEGASPTTTLVPFRDLCAVVSEQKAFGLDETTPESIAAHQAVVDTVFRRATVLPAPVGVVFRAPDVLKRWMELHYVSLTDALEFVEDRAAARVHIERADGRPGDLEAGSDLAAAASESLRALRRKAVASVPLRVESVTGLTLSAAFLVDHDLWKEFMHAVDEQRDAHHLLHFETTGPWAPYDFVRMQFGG
jgi:gas vesicle protein GvpL/GvpF